MLARHLRGCLDLFVPARRVDHLARDTPPRRAPEGDAARARARRLRLGAGPRAVAAHAGPRRCRAGEDGAPLFAAREPGGFVHAPSMAQASAAAVLRSGYPRPRRPRTTRARSRSTSRRIACASPSRCSTGSGRDSSSARCSATASSGRCTTGSSTASSRASAAVLARGACTEREELLKEVRAASRSRASASAPSRSLQRRIAARSTRGARAYELPPTAGVAEIEALAAREGRGRMGAGALFTGRGSPSTASASPGRQRPDRARRGARRRSSRRSTRSATR